MAESKNIMTARASQVDNYDRDSLWGYSQGLNEQIRTYNILLEDTSVPGDREKDEVQWNA